MCISDCIQIELIDWDLVMRLYTLDHCRKLPICHPSKICLCFPMGCFEQVFPPAFRDLPPPMLDLFDLDETFSSEKVRLAQLSNKCKC